MIFLTLGSVFGKIQGQLEKPNIIVFLVDDYDKPETSPYGGKGLNAQP